jgi:hypothetical protein
VVLAEAVVLVVVVSLAAAPPAATPVVALAVLVSAPVALALVAVVPPATPVVVPPPPLEALPLAASLSDGTGCVGALLHPIAAKPSKPSQPARRSRFEFRSVIISCLVALLQRSSHAERTTLPVNDRWSSGPWEPFLFSRRANRNRGA